MELNNNKERNHLFKQMDKLNYKIIKMNKKNKEDVVEKSIAYAIIFN